MNEALKHTQDGDNNRAGVALVEGLSFYRSIQPGIAKANASSDETVAAYFPTAPEDLTADLLNGVLTAINLTGSGLLVTQADLVTSFE